MLVGDTVVWRNGDATTHTVTADDELVRLRLPRAGRDASRATFPKTGQYAYHCTIHKFMHGVVRRRAGRALCSDRRRWSPVAVSCCMGLAPTGTERVVVTQSGADAKQRTVVPAADGSFSVAERVFRPVAYRALVGGLGSPLVRVQVAPKVFAGRNAGKLVAVVAPSRVGAHAALQAYVLERFAWRTVAHGVVSRGSRVAISLPAERRGRFRIVVRGGEGWADGVSQAVVLRR